MIALAEDTIKKALAATITKFSYIDLAWDDIESSSRLGGGSDFMSTVNELTRQINKALKEDDEEEAAIMSPIGADLDDDDRCPTCRAPFDEPHEEGCPDAPEESIEDKANRVYDP